MPKLKIKTPLLHWESKHPQQQDLLFNEHPVPSLMFSCLLDVTEGEILHSLQRNRNKQTNKQTVQSWKHLYLPSVACIQFLSHKAKGAKILSSDTSGQVHEPHLKVGGQLKQEKV